MRKVEFKEPPKKELPKGEKKCPRCEKVKDIAKEFGYREYKFQVYAQSQCMKCRGMKPICQMIKETEREAKARKEAQEIGKRIVEAADKLKPACKMIGHCCITMLGGVNDGLGCMYCRKPMEESEHPADIKAKAEALAREAEEAKKQKAKAAPKAQKQRHTWITGDKATLKVQYKQHFPNDTNNDKRTVKFMIQKLVKRLGDQARLTPSAQKILEG